MKKILLALAVFLAANIIYSQSTSIPSATGSGSSYYQTVQDEGSSVTQRATLNFVGAGVSCADATTKTTCTVSGGGVTAFTDLTDLEVSETSDSVATVAAGNVSCLDTSGAYTVTAMSSGTVTRDSGNASDTIRYAVNCNSGSPILVARIGTSITLGNYTCSGVTCTSGNAYLAGDQPLATIVVTSGNNEAPTDLRAISRGVEYLAGTGLDKTGRTFSLNTAGSYNWSGAQASDSTYNYCEPSGASGTTYACSISPAITVLTAGAHYFFKADVANTGSATINFNSLGAKTIKKYAGGAANLAADDIRAGVVVEVIYDGTSMQMVNQLGNAGSGGGTTSSRTTMFVTEEFASGGSTTGTIGELGWLFNNDSTAGTIAGTASTAGHPGQFRLNTTASSGARSRIQLAANYYGDFTSTNWEAIFVFKLATAVTAVRAVVGLNTEYDLCGVGSGRDCVALVYDSAVDSTWQLRSYTNTTNQTGSPCNTSITPGTTDWITLRLTGSGSSTITAGWRVNGGSESTCTVTMSTGNTTNFVPVFGMYTTDANAKAMDLDYFSFTQSSGLSR